MSEWISVKDRLPEIDADILYVVQTRSLEPYVVHGQRGWDGQNWWWCDEHGEYDEAGNEPGFSTVTYWQPFPKPPALTSQPEDRQ